VNGLQADPVLARRPTIRVIKLRKMRFS
jgi:hypothetical protein